LNENENRTHVGNGGVEAFMSVEKLNRVLELLHERFPNNKTVRRLELERAIMEVIGTSPRTVKENKKALVKLGWVKFGKRHVLILRHWLTGDVLGFGLPPPRVRDVAGADDEAPLESLPVPCRRHNGEGEDGACSECGKF